MRLVDSVAALLVVLSLSTPLSGCGSGGAGGAGGGGGATVDVEMRGRAVIALLAGATVEVFGYDDMDTPLATATTSSGEVADAGRFAVALEDVRATDLFLVVVRGGEALDVDEDGVLDPSPLPNEGVAHAVVTGAQLLEDLDVLVSSVSEIAYQRTRYLWAAMYPEAHVAKATAAAVTFVLRASLDLDDDVDADDGLLFDPAIHRDGLFRSRSDVSRLVSALVRGDSVAGLAFDLSAETLSVDVLPLDDAFDLDLRGSTTFVSAGFDGLHVFDHVARAPLANLATPGFCSAVQVVGDLAYLADGTGLLVVDVSDPATPIPVGSVPLPEADGLAVVGDRAYVIGRTGVLHVVGVAVPSAPALLRSVSTFGFAQAVAGDSTHAYVALADGGVQVFDASIPAATLTVGIFASADRMHALARRGEHLIAAADGGLAVFDVSVDPANPVTLGFVTTGDEGRPSDLVAAGDRIAVASGVQGLDVVDVADPAAPVYLGAIPTVGQVSSVAFGDGRFVGIDTGDRALIEIAPGTPPPSAVVATLALPATEMECVRGEPGRAWVGTNSPRGLFVLDASDALFPQLVGSTDDFPVLDVRLRDDLAFVAAGLGLVIVSDPAAPNALASSLRGGSAMMTSLDLGAQVVWGAAEDGIVVFDVSDVARPDILRTVPTASVEALAFDGGDSLVAAMRGEGIVVFDVSTQSQPLERGTAALLDALDVVAADGFAFVVDVEDRSAIGPGRLAVFDVAAAPRLVASLGLPGSPVSIERTGDRAFLGTFTAGVHVLDLSVADEPALVATLPVPGRVVDVSAAGDVVVAVGARGVSMLHGIRRAVP